MKVKRFTAFLTTKEKNTMEKIKVLELVPEELRPTLIEEVQELIEKEKKLAASKPPTKEQLDEVFKRIK